MSASTEPAKPDNVVHFNFRAGADAAEVDLADVDGAADGDSPATGTTTYEGATIPSTDSPALRLVYRRLINAGSRWDQSGQDWTCPAHDDERPSLGVAAGDTVPVLIKCQAGCEPDDVMAAIGLVWSELYLSEATDSKPKVSGAYRFVYESAEGVPLFVVIRIEYSNKSRKDFKQFPVDVTGKITKRGKGAMAGVPLVLFGLPKVRRAVERGETVYLLEGEKGVQAVGQYVRARRRKLVTATTAPGGAAKKWQPEWTEQLRGAGEVVIVADNDPSGFKCARFRYDALTKAGIRTRVVRSRTRGHKDDIVEHLNEGYLIEELEPVDRADLDTLAEFDLGDADPTGYLLVKASDVRAAHVEWVWEAKDTDSVAGLVAAGELTLLAGREGIGKSAVAYQVAADLTRGRLAGCHHDNPRNVLAVATEDSWEHTVKPRLVAAEADLERVLLFKVKLAGSDGTRELQLDTADLAKLRHAINATEAAVVILDPLMSRLSGKVDSHKDAEVRSQLEPLTAVAHDTRCAVIGLIHVNKGSGSDLLNLIMGSRAFSAVARGVLFAMEDPDNVGTMLFGQAKNNLGRKLEGSLTYSITSQTVEVDGLHIDTAKLVWGARQDTALKDALAQSQARQRGPSRKGEAVAWLVEYLRDQPDRAASAAAIKQAASEDGITHSTLHAARKQMQVDGRLTTERAKEEHGPATWQLVGGFGFKLGQPEAGS